MSKLPLNRRSFLAASAAVGGAAAAVPLLAACGGSSGSATAGASAIASATLAAGTPKRGGLLRVGLGGGGAMETADAHVGILANTDLARSLNLYATLFKRDPETLAPIPSLAESAESDATGSTWTVRLIDGAEFHDGKSITAEDLIFTVQRIFEQKGAVAELMPWVDPAGMKALDARTVQFNLKSPTAIFTEPFAMIASGIVPIGYDPANPIGSGPFALKSFTPGELTSMKRFENHFSDVWLDELDFVSFNDDSSRINALLAGQIQATEALPPGQIAAVQADGKMQIIESLSGATRFFAMAVDEEPFTDVRVRQAMRLLVDRQQMIDQALAGYGEVANDTFNKYAAMYDSSLVREQNIEEAKSLLKSAGKSDLTVELATAPYIAGTVEASQVLVQQAKEAGVTVNLKKMDLPAYFEGYGKWPFSGDFFNGNEYFIQAGLNQLPTSTYNITHFNDDEYNTLYKQGVAELDEAKRKDIAAQMQKIEFDRGGNLIWTYAKVVDAVAEGVNGFVPDKYGLPLTSYDFARAWMS